MQTIEITGATGTGPYDIYLCDITLTYCFLISGSTSIPPTVTFELPSSLTNPYPPPPLISFVGASSVIIKLVDLSDGCEKFILYNCNYPTPTQTPTPTPTPTPTSLCRCITVTLIDELEQGSFTYTDCDGVISPVLIVPPSTVLYVCGSSPTPIDNVITTIGDVCGDTGCEPIISPTPTPSQTPTQTPTPTQLPSNKIFQIGDTFIFMGGDIYIFENQ